MDLAKTLELGAQWGLAGLLACALVWVLWHLTSRTFPGVLRDNQAALGQLTAAFERDSERNRATFRDELATQRATHKEAMAEVTADRRTMYAKFDDLASEVRAAVARPARPRPKPEG